jgi:hypothetical protein
VKPGRVASYFLLVAGYLGEAYMSSSELRVAKDGLRIELLHVCSIYAPMAAIRTS